MRYDEMLRIDERYQTSINLQYDLGNLRKLDCYIPTEQSVRILKQYLDSVYFGQKAADRATVLVGPYGKGKSHLMLVLLSLLCQGRIFDQGEGEGANFFDVGQRLIQRIASVDAEAGALASAVCSEHRPLLPVIVSGSGDINQALILALRDALERGGCSDLLPKTNFDAAMETIKRWESSYPAALESLGKELMPYKMSMTQLKDGLASCNHDCYEVFVRVYPAITLGSAFAPMFSSDVIYLFRSVNAALAEQTCFGGMFIVFDEFSKFLEANLEKSKMMSFKVIQEIAELAVRSGDEQLHFACITHKDLLDYANSDSFRTVAGRFKSILYVQSSTQAYELVANAIEKKEPDYAKFFAQNQGAFETLRQMTYGSGLFHSISADVFDRVLLYGCFPLAPVTVYALLRINEKVAQNERTLFTFLAGKTGNSVIDYIQREFVNAAFITIDALYDYFQDLFYKEVFNSPVHNIWSKTESALKIAKTEDQKRIAKAMAIISIVGDDQLKLTALHIRTSLLMDDETFIRETSELSKLHVLTKRDVSGTYAFLTANGVDIQKSIANYISTKLPTISRREVLTMVADLGYVLPRQYNDSFKMIRYFKRIYMEAREFVAYPNGAAILEDYPFDGVIVLIVASGDDERDLALKHYELLQGRGQIMLAVSSVDFSLDGKLQEYIAIQALKKSDTAKADEHYSDELDIYEEDLARYLHQTMLQTYSPSCVSCTYYYDGAVLESMVKEIHLSRKVSEICENLFPHTPVINNEMINKDSLTAPIRKARAEVMGRLLSTSIDDGIDMFHGYGPAVSIARAMFIGKELRSRGSSNDPGLNAVLEEMRAFVRSAIGQKRSFRELYNLLLKPPFGVRKGIVPVYVAFVLAEYRDIASIYSDERELSLNADVLERVNDNPEHYQLYVDISSTEKEAYLNALSTFLPKGAQDANTTIPDVVERFQRWMRSLPRATKAYKNDYTLKKDGSYEAMPADRDMQRLRVELLKFDINQREFLMDRMLGDVLRLGDFAQAAVRLHEIFNILNSHLSRLKRFLTDYSRASFADAYTGSLAQAVAIWRGRLPEATRNRLYDVATNSIIKMAFTLKSNDDEWILGQLAMYVVGVAIEDWSDESVETYCNTLRSILQAVDETRWESPSSSDDLQISIEGFPEKIHKQVSNTPISLVGRTLMNNLRASIDEYADSVLPDEKIAILIQIVKEVMGE